MEATEGQNVEAGIQVVVESRSLLLLLRGDLGVSLIIEN
jgi:hypothetical protein